MPTVLFGHFHHHSFFGLCLCHVNVLLYWFAVLVGIKRNSMPHPTWLSPVMASAAQDGQGVQRIDMDLGDYQFHPKTVSIAAGTSAELILTNRDLITPHNFIVEAPEAGMEVNLDVSAGESATIVLRPTRSGIYTFLRQAASVFRKPPREGDGRPNRSDSRIGIAKNRHRRCFCRDRTLACTRARCSFYLHRERSSRQCRLPLNLALPDDPARSQGGMAMKPSPFRISTFGAVVAAWILASSTVQAVSSF